MAETKKTENIKTKSGLMGKALEISGENKGRTGKGLLKHITEKSGARNMTKVIVEKNGVFVIQPDIETSEVKQDPALKALIDSVLK